jgi:hypothetical protein
MNQWRRICAPALFWDQDGVSSYALAVTLIAPALGGWCCENRRRGTEFEGGRSAISTQDERLRARRVTAPNRQRSAPMCLARLRVNTCRSRVDYRQLSNANPWRWKSAPHAADPLPWSGSIDDGELGGDGVRGVNHN